MIEIKENEVPFKQYEALHNLTNAGVRHRVRNNLVKWRYIFPETEEYIVIEKDSYIPKKSGPKRKADKV